MTDTVVMSAATSPPLAVTQKALLDQWSNWKAALLGLHIYVKIFVNNIIISTATTLADLTECSSPGYTSTNVVVLNGPFLDQGGNAYMTTPESLFVCTGGGTDLCYGAYLVEGTGTASTVAFTLSAGAYTLPVVTDHGGVYLVPPRITVTGATGSGAILEAVLTGTTLTGVTIVDGGTGYTTVTATIEEPYDLVAAGNFPAPRPLQLVTDAIPVVIELDNLAS